MVVVTITTTAKQRTEVAGRKSTTAAVAATTTSDSVGNLIPLVIITTRQRPDLSFTGVYTLLLQRVVLPRQHNEDRSPGP